MRKQTVRLHKPQLLNGKSTANTSVVKDMDGLKNLAASLQQNVAFATQNKEAAFYTIGLSGTFFIVAFFFAALCLAADTALMYGVTASSWRDLSGNVPQSDALHIALSSLQGVLAVLGLHFFFKDVEPEIRRKSIFVMGILILIFASCLGITAADMEWLQHQERHGGQSPARGSRAGQYTKQEWFYSMACFYGTKNYTISNLTIGDSFIFRSRH